MRFLSCDVLQRGSRQTSSVDVLSSAKRPSVDADSKFSHLDKALADQPGPSFGNISITTRRSANSPVRRPVARRLGRRPHSCARRERPSARPQYPSTAIPWQSKTRCPLLWRYRLHGHRPPGIFVCLSTSDPRASLSIPLLTKPSDQPYPSRRANRPSQRSLRESSSARQRGR
jgi:hypothetical protein